MTEIATGDYPKLLGEIKERIRSAQYEALRAVNRELIGLYWDIGHLIVERQAGDAWGKSVVETLARDLREEFPGLQGFSASNLWRMKLFYDAYAADEKLAPLVREIGWSHNLAILEKCKDDAQREFYLRRTREMGWTKNVLIHQIENRTYEKTLRSQTNFAQTLPAEVAAQAKLAVKDEYTFDFLELGDEYAERQLEAAILAQVEPFLREMGGVFSFIGSQYRLELSGHEYFI
jgi:predicted nuclease of restriction endonuclease-like (RecB) superfamily